MQDALGVRVGHDATEVGGSLVADARAQDDGLGVLLLIELEHLGEREGAADVGVQHKQAVGAALEDGIAEVVEAAGCAEGLILAEVFDGDAGELLGRVLDEVAEHRLVIVADDADFLDLLVGNACDGRQAVPDDGVAGHFEEGFRDVEGERSETSAAGRSTNLLIKCQCTGRDCVLMSLRIRTRMTAFVEPLESLVRCVMGTWRDIVAGYEGVEGGWR